MENSIEQNRNIQVPNYSGVNIQIFNPTVATDGSAIPPATVNTNNYTTNPMNAYPANYYMQNLTQNNAAQSTPAQTTPAENKPEPAKAKKQKITQLTDEYVKTLESYLNSQDTEVRAMAAKDVFARMQEDPSRKNDPVLIAFSNKILKDPSQPIRFVAMSAIEGQLISGDNETIAILKSIQAKRNSKNPQDNADAVKASKALLQLTKTNTSKEIEG